MQAIPRYLKNYQSIIKAFGYWPLFHDAPVSRFLFDGQRIELALEAWETSRDRDAQGYFIQTKKHQVVFHFSEIVASELDHFIPNNILFALVFSSEEFFKTHGSFSVELNSAMGSDLCGNFKARFGKVASVRPIQDRFDTSRS